MSYDKEEEEEYSHIYIGGWYLFYQVWKKSYNKPLVRSDTYTNIEPPTDK